MKKFLFLLFVNSGCSPETQKNTSIDQNWDTYLGDPGRSHFSPLSEITRENVEELELAWTYDSGEMREGNSTMYTSPLVIDGVLYGLSPKLVAFALDAATGEELWRSNYVGPGAAQRGLMWWENGDQCTPVLNLPTAGLDYGCSFDDIYSQGLRKLSSLFCISMLMSVLSGSC